MAATHLWTLVIISACSVTGWLALWSAVTPRPWLLRVGVIAATPAAMALISAYEPAVLLLMQSVCVVGLVHLHQRRSEGRRFGWPKFSLRGLLKATLVAAGLMWLISRLPHHDLHVWLSALGAGGIAGVSTSLGAWLASTQRPRWQRMVVLAGSVPVLGLQCVTLQGSPYWNLSKGELWLESCANVGGVILLTWAWISLSRASSKSRRETTPSQASGFPLILRRIAFIMLTAAIVLPYLALYASMFTTPDAPMPKIPRPNGFDDLQAAAQMLITSPILEDPETAPLPALRAELAKNEAAFRRLRLGLDKPCEQHLDYDAPLIHRMNVISNRRSLARALMGEGRDREAAQLPDEASISYLDVIRYGHNSVRGGIDLDLLVGYAFEGLGIYGLTNLHKQVSDDQLVKLLHTLIQLEQSREPFAEAELRNPVYYDTANGWSGRLYVRLIALSEGDANQQIMRTAEKRYRTLMRLMIVELALELHRRREGHLPDSLREAPELLEDPFAAASGELLRYVRNGDHYQLYGLGPDQVDDGGRRPPADTSDQEPGYDMALDVPDQTP